MMIRKTKNMLQCPQISFSPWEKGLRTKLIKMYLHQHYWSTLPIIARGLIIWVMWPTYSTKCDLLHMHLAATSYIPIATPATSATPHTPATPAITTWVLQHTLLHGSAIPYLLLCWCYTILYFYCYAGDTPLLHGCYIIVTSPLLHRCYTRLLRWCIHV